MQLIEQTWFTTCLASTALVEKLKNISLIVSDVDGCLTDGTKAWHCDGSTSKRFSFLDGMSIRNAQNAGLTLALISGDRTPITATRAKMLGIPDDLCRLVHWKEKIPTLQEIHTNHGITPAQTLMFGDDTPDLVLKPYVSLFACPADVVWYMAAHADIKSPRPGGQGALRLVIDLLLYVQNKHPQQELIAATL